MMVDFDLALEKANRILAQPANAPGEATERDAIWLQVFLNAAASRPDTHEIFEELLGLPCPNCGLELTKDEDRPEELVPIGGYL